MDALVDTYLAWKHGHTEPEVVDCEGQVKFTVQAIEFFSKLFFLWQMVNSF